MAVYVDDYRIPWRGGEWSHLLADSTEELHAFAAGLRLPRRRFHHKPVRPWQDHYDLLEREREAAIRLGARPISCAEAAARLRAKRRALAEADRELAAMPSVRPVRGSPPRGHGHY